MKILRKVSSNRFNGFDWLNFDYLPDSEGYKFEIYLDQIDNLVPYFVSHFYSLFGQLSDELVIGTFANCMWGDFCLDTWDVQNDRYDYSSSNKGEPTASYLDMLHDSEIEPNYQGYCQCVDWNIFLYVTLSCVIKHTAPYSMMFYAPTYEFVYYFHHSGSLGVYYREFNDEIKMIIRKAKEENLEINNTNDARIVSMIA